MSGASRRRTLFAAILAVMGGLASVSSTAAQTAPADWPQARSGAHAMAYDSRRGLALMYGDRSADSTTLWGWDGQRWHAFPSDDGPGLRRHIKLAYDSARDRLVLYGGYDNSGRTILGDTWEWDGTRWHRFAVEGPGPRSSYALVYDAARAQIVLFGGLSDQGTMGDMWAWNGVQWTKLADAGPSPRGEASAVYDPRTREIILAGGFPYERVTFPNGRSTWSVLRDQIAADTWAWNGTTWRLLDDAGIARFSPMSIDPASGAPIRIAGESAGSFHGDMLHWSAGGWRVVGNARIPTRHGPAATLDTRRNRVVLYGGSTQGGEAFGDLWEWDGTRWTEMPRSSNQ